MPNSVRSSSGSLTKVPLTFSAMGNRGGSISMSSSTRRIGSTAGSINGEWNAPATFSRTARIFCSDAIASARSIAATDPLITDLDGGVLVRDQEHVVAPRLVAQLVRCSVPTPSSAVMVPGRSSPARCIASPRTTTRPKASGSSMAPEATNAANSPRE